MRMTPMTSCLFSARSRALHRSTWLGSLFALLISAMAPAWGQTAPDIPTSLTATAGNREIILTFTPQSDGGSPILYYTARCGAYTGIGPGTPLSVEVDNGASYSCRVTATNAFGTSEPSTAIIVALPVGIPGRPGLVNLVQGPAGSGLGEARIQNSAPSGGAEIRSYTVNCIPLSGGATISLTGPTLTLPLTRMLAGVSYQCRAKARNHYGDGPESIPDGATVTMALAAGAPQPPTTTFALAGNATATVSFNPTPSQGSSVLTSYTALCAPPEGPDLVASGKTSPIMVTGLLNGRPHFCRVMAVNVHASSAPSNGVYVTPSAELIVPAAPQNLAVTAGSNQATLAFGPPADGSTPMGYVGVCNPGGHSAIGTQSPLVVTGMAGGSTYSCSVTAHNGVATGPASAPKSVTLQGTAAQSYQDVWWNGPSGNGWGLNIGQSGNTLVAGWYIFGANGLPGYVLMLGGSWNPGLSTFTGPIIQPISGAPYYAYDPAFYMPGPTIGSMSLTFNNANDAVMTYNIYGITGSKSIIRLRFNDDPKTNTYAGIWWGGPDQNGWGIAIPPQQGETLVGAWYTFVDDGSPFWYILTSLRKSEGVFTGQIYTGTGAPTIAPTYDPTKFRSFEVGEFQLIFTDANNGTFIYGSGGFGTAMPIRRLQF